MSVVVLGGLMTPAVAQEVPASPTPHAEPPAGIAGDVSDVTWSRGVLTIVGTGDAADSLSLSCNVNVLTVNSVGPVEGKTVACDKVKIIKIVGRGGTDSVSASLVKMFFPLLEHLEFVGGPGNDYFTGWEGRDVMSGGGGNDYCGMLLGPGSCNGGKGQDTVSIVGNNPKAFGTYVRSSSGKVTVAWVESANLSGIGDFDDTVDASKWSGTSAWLYGQVGNDTFIGCTCRDIVYGGSGADTADGDKGDDTFVVESGNDDFTGGRGMDTVSDTMGTTSVTLSDISLNDSGKTSINSLSGIEHAYLVGNTSGVITVNATAWTGTSQIYGGAGNDTLLGGAGDDQMAGYLGTDSVDGNGGTDTLMVWGSGSYALNAAHTQLTGSWSTDTLADLEGANYRGSTGADVFNGGAVTSPTFAMALFGDDGGDTLTGGAAGDWIYGEGGDDTLTGNGGNDTIDGGAGNDACSGGTGTNALTGCP